MKNVENKDMLHCTGCGLCESICPVQAIKIKEKNGFLRPNIDEKKCILCGKCVNHCPGLQKDDIVCKYNMFNKILYGHSMAELTRSEAASGGVTTELLRYVLQWDIVDYVVTAAEYHYNRSLGYRIITKENINDLYTLSGSNYCPTNIGGAIKEIRIREGSCLIVCLPCLARGIRKLQETDDILKKKIKYVVSLLCNHVPSYNATDYLLKKYNLAIPDIVKYRGKGWFGHFRAYKLIGREKKLIREIPFSQYFTTGFSYYFWQPACLDCKDHFGNYADICMGDADFIKYRREVEENQGETICFIKNVQLLKVIKEMERHNYIYLRNDISDNELELIYGPLTQKRGDNQNLWNDTEKIIKNEQKVAILKEIRSSRFFNMMRKIRRILNYEK